MQTEDISIHHTDYRTLPPVDSGNGPAAQKTKNWHWIALGIIVILSAFLNLFQIQEEGYGNEYYAAAIKSMLTSWHNFFFVSFDPGGFVTVDKPPLALWVQAASAKIFGFSGFSILLPQAVAGVLSVILLYHLVRRTFGPGAGLLAALALAITPINVVMNRDNNIDPQLVLMMLLATWAVCIATEKGSLRWLVLGAVLIGLAFNIKTLEAYLVVPALGLLYLLGSPRSWRVRILHLVVVTVVMLIVSFAWIEAVDLTPAADRPYVGSSQTNSEFELTVGYNGIERLLGQFGSGFGGGSRSGGSAPQRTTSSNSQSTSSTATTSKTSSSTSSTETASAAPSGSQAGPSSSSTGAPSGAGGGSNTTGFFGLPAAGIARMFTVDLGGQVSWLLPLAIIGMLALAWQTRIRFPLNRQLQALILWGMWLLTMGIFFSVASFIHTYYLVIIAPAISALAGIGLVLLWQDYRERPLTDWRSWMLPVALLLTAAEQVFLLTSYTGWGWLSPLIISLCLLAAIVLVIARLPFSARLRPNPQSWARPAVAAAMLALLLTPLVWSGYAVATAEGGAVPTAGPTASGGSGGFGGGGAPSGITRTREGGENGTFGADGGFPGGGDLPSGGGFPGNGSTTSRGEAPNGSGTSTGNSTPTNGGSLSGGGAGGGAGVDSQLLSYLEAHQGKARFILAVPSAGSAESIIIETGKAVMAMGGFSGSDPILTVSSLKQLVKNGTVRFFMLSGGIGGGGSSTVTSWVTTNCKTVSSSAWETSSQSSSTTSSQSSGLYDCLNMA